MSFDPRSNAWAGGPDMTTAFSGINDLSAATEALGRFNPNAPAYTYKESDSAGGVAFAPGASPLDEKRRRAFLDAPDSATGMRNVRSTLAQEAGLGAGPHWNRSVKELEAAAGRGAMARAFTAAPPAPGGMGAAGPNLRGFQMQADLGPQANQQAAAIPDQPAGQGLDRSRVTAAFSSAPMVASSGETLAEAFNNQLQGAGAELFRRSAVPLSQPVSSAPVNLQVSRGEGDTERMMAAAAGSGEEFPITEGQVALAAQNAGIMRGGGRFKPGNTVPLPPLDRANLPPLGSRYVVSGVVPGFIAAGMV